jgi:hypothetical protein
MAAKQKKCPYCPPGAVAVWEVPLEHLNEALLAAVPHPEVEMAKLEYEQSTEVAFRVWVQGVAADQRRKSLTRRIAAIDEQLGEMQRQRSQRFVV